MADRFDVVVVGGGSGGYYAALRLAQLGRSVAVVERDKLGGTCLHRGCIPTKIYLESAELLDRIRHAADFGVSVDAPKLDFGTLAKRRGRLVGANEHGIKTLLRRNGVESIAGDARLATPGKVIVKAGRTERELAAGDVLIATGSRPKSLPGLEVDGNLVVTSDQVTNWTELPRSIIVVGAGAVGAEIASAMRDFGLDVTLVEFLPRVLPLEDPDVAQVVERSFAKRGIRVLTGARVLPDTLSRRKNDLTVEVDVGGERQKVTAERLLIATGREAVTDGLGLEQVGVRLADRGFVQVDGQMRTSAHNVYACGDVVGGLMLAHVAFAEGAVAAQTIAGQPAPAIDYGAMPRATYTRPEVASFGLTEEEAGAAGRDIDVGTVAFQANPKAMIHGESDGLVKVVSDAGTGEILGAHMVGPSVTELVHEMVAAKVLESTPHEIAWMVHGHPTLAEAVAEAAGEIVGRAVHSHKPSRRK